MWFNIFNEAYGKARYSKRYQISKEALPWLIERAAHLHDIVKLVCDEHLERLEQAAKHQE